MAISLSDDINILYNICIIVGIIIVLFSSTFCDYSDGPTFNCKVCPIYI